MMSVHPTSAFFSLWLGVMDLPYLHYSIHVEHRCTLGSTSSSDCFLRMRSRAVNVQMFKHACFGLKMSSLVWYVGTLRNNGHRH